MQTLSGSRPVTTTTTRRVAAASPFRAAAGPQPIPTLHLCRCGSKKVVRLLVRLEECGVAFDPILYRFANLLANFFFVLTVYLKQRWQVPEVPYVSINY